MADQKGGAGIVGDHFLQQVQGLQIEVVGGLVQYQEIGRHGEQLGEQEPRPLAAGKHLDRSARLLRA